MLHTRVESGSDGPDYLGHFLVDQVGLIHKLNYLDVTRIYNRSHVLLEQVDILISKNQALQSIIP